MQFIPCVGDDLKEHVHSAEAQSGDEIVSFLDFTVSLHVNTRVIHAFIFQQSFPYITFSFAKLISSIWSLLLLGEDVCALIFRQRCPYNTFSFAELIHSIWSLLPLSDDVCACNRSQGVYYMKTSVMDSLTFLFYAEHISTHNIYNSIQQTPWHHTYFILTSTCIHSPFDYKASSTLSSPSSSTPTTPTILKPLQPHTTPKWPLPNAPP